MEHINLSFLALCILPLFFLIFLKLILHPHPTKIPIKSRHVFITGGSSGIGLALARQAAAEGAQVTILALDNLEEAKTSLKLSTRADVTVLKADVCDFEAVKEAVASVRPIDVLVCNQGVFMPQEVDKQDMKEMERMIDVNLVGMFSLVKAVLPGMKKRSDPKPVSITFMSSQAGQVGIYGYAAYSASKFGLRGLAEALQQEVIAYDIHVSLIFPPETNTPALAKARNTMPQLTSIIAATSAEMEADEVAKKALDGIKSGHFSVTCNLLGFALSIATAGLSPQRSYLMAFVEVIFAGVIRVAALCVQWSWYRSIEKYFKQVN